MSIILLYCSLLELLFYIWAKIVTLACFSFHIINTNEKRKYISDIP